MAVSILAIYGTSLVLIAPHGEFPLNDDWAYAWSVRHLLDTGELRLSEWTSATVVIQLLCGALFAKIAGGFSFEALRFSTLAISLLGCFALYGLLRELDVSRRGAFLGAVTLATNPIYLYLSFTFMSDVFFLTPMVCSLALYARGLRTNSWSTLAAASAMASSAYLARQLGLAIPIAVILTLFVQSRRPSWARLAAVGLLPISVFVIHTLWLTTVHGVPWGFEVNAIHNSVNTLLDPRKPFQVAWRFLVSALYMGVFTLPIGMVLAADSAHQPSAGKQFRIWLLAMVTFVVVMSCLTRAPMPYLPNIINRDGIGPLTLVGTKTPVTPSWVFWIATGIAPFVAALQCRQWSLAIANVRRDRQDPLCPVLLTCGLMAILMAVIVILWDEYLVVFVPAALAVSLRARTIRWKGMTAGLVSCVAMLVYATAELSDYFAWNRARWAAGRSMVAQGVSPDTVDGGFEWVGWYEFEKALPIAIARGQATDLFAWTRITPDIFVLAFSPISGYSTVLEVPYQGWALGPKGSIYVLRRRGTS